MLLSIISFNILSIVYAIYDTVAPSSSAPEASQTFSYTNNDSSQFIIPSIIAIISIVVGIAIYAATRSAKNKNLH